MPPQSRRSSLSVACLSTVAVAINSTVVSEGKMEWCGGGVGEESEPFSSLSSRLNDTGNILVDDICGD